MEKMTIRVDQRTANAVRNLATEAGLAVAEAARQVMVRGIESPTSTDQVAELQKLLRACLRASAAAASISELIAERGLNSADLAALRKTGQEKIDYKYGVLLEMFDIAEDGGAQ